MPVMIGVVRWLKIVVISSVLVVWMFYLINEIARGNSVPPLVWTVPGATAGLLSNSISAIRIGKSEVEMRKDDE